MLRVQPSVVRSFSHSKTPSHTSLKFPSHSHKYSPIAHIHAPHQASRWLSNQAPRKPSKEDKVVLIRRHRSPASIRGPRKRPSVSSTDKEELRIPHQEKWTLVQGDEDVGPSLRGLWKEFLLINKYSARDFSIMSRARLCLALIQRNWKVSTFLNGSAYGLCRVFEMCFGRERDLEAATRYTLFKLPVSRERTPLLPRIREIITQLDENNEYLAIKRITSFKLKSVDGEIDLEDYIAEEEIQEDSEDDLFLEAMAIKVEYDAVLSVRKRPEPSIATTTTTATTPIDAATVPTEAPNPSTSTETLAATATATSVVTEPATEATTTTTAAPTPTPTPIEDTAQPQLAEGEEIEERNVRLIATWVGRGFTELRDELLETAKKEEVDPVVFMVMHRYAPNPKWRLLDMVWIASEL